MRHPTRPLSPSCVPSKPYDRFLSHLGDVASLRKKPGEFGCQVAFRNGVTMTVSPRGPDNTIVNIASLESRRKGCGYGRAAMKFMLAICDKVGLRAILEAKPYGNGGLDREALDRFY